MTERNTETVPLAAVVGRNARRLRGDVTADRLARAVRKRGLNWGTGRISDLEHGRVSPTISTLVVLADALNSVRNERTITLADLVEHDGSIELTATEAVKDVALQRFLRGDPVVLLIGDMSDSAERKEELNKLLGGMPKFSALLPDGIEIDLRTVIEVERHGGETEERIARSLGVPLIVVAAASAQLWGRTISAERDRRAGPDANAQDRGRITRQLKSEIRAVLDGDHQ